MRSERGRGALRSRQGNLNNSSTIVNNFIRFALMNSASKRIRNFVIIAHVDHGKSTLADRFLELTGTVEPRKMHEQYLDRLELERERGITIKMQPVRMVYRPAALENRPGGLGGIDEVDRDRSTVSISPSEAPPTARLPAGQGRAGIDQAERSYILNLIDTPGHADFAYEVSRALAAVEGAILLVDATQGIQAQTLSNLELARSQGLAIIPAVNKIDLARSESEQAALELARLLGIEPKAVFLVSAKTGEGVRELLTAAIERIPPPANARGPAGGDQMFAGLIFDSNFDPYQGVVAHVRVFSGVLRSGDAFRCLATGAEFSALEAGIFSPDRTPRKELGAGEIGYVATGLKEAEKIRAGDTLVRVADAGRDPPPDPLPGYREPALVVFASMFPENQDDYRALREALSRLKLEDSALVSEPEDSPALGRGVRTGFLGLLHLEIVSERLRREYGLRLIITSPSVPFRVHPKRGGAPQTVFSASRLPDASEIAAIEEPWAELEIVTPGAGLGAASTLLAERGGRILEARTLSADRLLVIAEAPLREVIVDFADRLKSATRGFASFSAKPAGFRPAALVRLDLRVAGTPVPALAEVVPQAEAYHIGRSRVERLKSLLPQELFPVAIQAEVGGRIIARETIPALRKDVTGYLYGGDRTRKMKLWAKQKRGKARLRAAGRVTIPAAIFVELLKR